MPFVLASPTPELVGDSNGTSFLQTERLELSLVPRTSKLYLVDNTDLHGETLHIPAKQHRTQCVVTKKVASSQDVEQALPPFDTSSVLSSMVEASVTLQAVHEEASPSLYPGLRALIEPSSITTIISHHAGLTSAELERAANIWNSVSAITHVIHVELLKSEFGMVLAVPYLPSAAAHSSQGVELRVTSGHGKLLDEACDSDGQIQRSDFEASAFMAFMPARAYPIIRKADPEDLARRMLPASGIPSGARFVAACFWAFLCIIDDLTEDGECADCINTCIVSLSTIQSLSQLSKSINNIWSRTSPENHALKDCKVVITAFHHAVSLTNLFPTSSQNDAWKLDFWREVGTVVQALRNEDTLHNRSFSMCEWMRLRILTISARPFMVLARAGLGLPTNLDNLFNCPRINQMQVLVQGITGLQNDILGWQKDHTEKNTMCAVEILIRDGMPLKEAFKQALESHNVVLRALLTLAECGGQPPAGGWDLYVRVLVGFTHAMAMWMLTSKRYRVMTENMKLRFEQTL